MKLLRPSVVLQIGIPVIALPVLFWVGTYDFLTFHVLAEGFSSLVGFFIFAVSALTLHRTQNWFLYYLGAGYFWIASADILHTLAYKGMGLIGDGTANPATQYWIATRLLEAVLVLTAPVFLKRSLNPVLTFILFGLCFLLMQQAVTWQWLPAAYIEGQGLTAFKITAEYVVMGILLLAWLHLWQNRSLVSRFSLSLTSIAIFLTILTEFAFTSYGSVFDNVNILGHLIKILSFWALLVLALHVATRSVLQVRLQSWFGASRRRIFLILTAIIFVIDALFVLVNNSLDRMSFEKTLEQETRTLESGFDMLMEQTFHNMLSIASFIASEDDVREILSDGADALQAEGGGRGGPETARLRALLLEKVGLRWTSMQDQYLVRQLHFHFHPGAISFLRVHSPKKFGDSLQDIRFTVVDAARENKAISGFETGRVYSGLRGALPVYRPGNGRTKEDQAGTLEVGTSFSPIAAILDQGLGQGVGVLLSMSHIRETMWPDAIRRRFPDNPLGCNCVLEAESRPGLKDIIAEGSKNGINFREKGVHLLEVGDIPWIVTSLPLRDYYGNKVPDRPQAGSVLFWRDGSTEIANQRRERLFNFIYGIFGFILVEALIFLGFRLALRRLETEIADKTAALQRSNQELEQFAHVISHDLQEPLRMISGYLALLDKRYGADLEEGGRTFLGYSLAASGRMTAMIRDLLAFSRVQTQGEAFRQLDMNQVLTAAVENVSVALQESNARLILPENLPDLPGDESQLVRLLQNLIANATKFRRADTAPEIRISAWIEDGKLVMTVSDNGIGLPPGSEERIFDSFERLHREEYEGTGMGLAICKRIVERHGGSIRAENNIEKGALFQFALPL